MNGVITLTQPAEDPLLGVVILRAHVNLLSVGLRNSRMPMKKILGKVTEITGERYPSSNEGAKRAYDDLNAVIKKMKGGDNV